MSTINTLPDLPGINDIVADKLFQRAQEQEEPISDVTDITDIVASDIDETLVDSEQRYSVTDDELTNLARRGRRLAAKFKSDPRSVSGHLNLGQQQSLIAAHRKSHSRSAAIEILYTKVRKLMIQMVHKYLRKHGIHLTDPDYKDLLKDMDVVFLEAVDKYQFGSKMKPSSFIATRVNMYITVHLSKYYPTSPTRATLSLAAKVRRMEEQLSTDGVREDDQKEIICTKLSMTAEIYDFLQRVMDAQYVSLDAVYGKKGDRIMHEYRNSQGLIANPEEANGEFLLNLRETAQMKDKAPEIKEAITRFLIRSHRGPQDHAVSTATYICEFTGFNAEGTPKSCKKIGAEYGCSKQNVHQIIQRAIKAMSQSRRLRAELEEILK